MNLGEGSAKARPVQTAIHVNWTPPQVQSLEEAQQEADGEAVTFHRLISADDMR